MPNTPTHFEQFTSVDELTEGDTVKVRFTTKRQKTREVVAEVERPTGSLKLSGEIAGEKTEMTLLTDHHELWATGGNDDVLLGGCANVVGVAN